MENLMKLPNIGKTLAIKLNKMLFELNSSHCGVGLVSELDNVVSPYIFKNGGIGIDIRIIENQIIITKVMELRGCSNVYYCNSWRM